MRRTDAQYAKSLISFQNSYSLSMLTSSIITIVSFTLKVSLSREHPTRNDVKKLLHHIRGLFVKLWPRAITLTYFRNVVLRDHSPAMLITSLLELASTLQMVHAAKYVVLFRKNKLFLGEQITSRQFGKSTYKNTKLHCLTSSSLNYSFILWAQLKLGFTKRGSYS